MEEEERTDERVVYDDLVDKHTDELTELLDNHDMKLLRERMDEMQEYDEALNSLRNAESACDKEELRVLITGYLGLTYFEKRMYKEALPYLKEALIYYPTYPDLSEKYSYCEAMCQ